MSDREDIMRRWDTWRSYIKDGGGGSWPRDEFESLLDAMDEVEAENTRLREALERIVREWSAAPDPLYQQLKNLWLVETMEPAIDAARAALAKEVGQSAADKWEEEIQ